MTKKLLISLAALMVISSVGCEYSHTYRTTLKAKAPETTPSASPVAPSSDAKETAKGDEIIKPKDSAPVSDPAPAPAPATPAPKTPSDSPSATPSSDPVPLPPPAVGPGASDPVVVEKPRTLSMGDQRRVTCEGCVDGTSAAPVHEFRCPAGYAVTGFEIATDSFEISCDSGLGEGCISGSTDVVGGLRLRCSQLDIEGTHYSKISSYAFYAKAADASEEGYGLEGVTLAGGVDRADRKDACADGSGVATGFFLRSGARLDSFGLFCGTYISTPKVTFILPSNKETYMSEGSLYGGMPGTGGAAHDVKCDANEVIVGASVSSGDQVDGIFDIICAKVEATY